jgi:hypothetical protein
MAVLAPNISWFSGRAIPQAPRTLRVVFRDEPVRSIGRVGVQTRIVHGVSAPECLKIRPILDEPGADVLASPDSSMTRYHDTTTPALDVLKPGQALLIVAERIRRPALEVEKRDLNVGEHVTGDGTPSPGRYRAA